MILAMSRRILNALILATLISGTTRADYIRSFDVQIKVNRDATLDVTETIDIVFTSPRHGIYRHIPVRYERYNNAFSIDLRLQSITDESGSRVNYSTARQGRDISMKIGDKDATLTGAHTYRI